MGAWRNEALLTGRVLLVLCILAAGFRRIVAFEGGCPSGCAPLLSGILECSCALGVLVGFRARLASLILILYLLPSLVFGHLMPSWAADDPVTREREASLALLNLSLIGGLVLLGITGPGKHSIDGK